MSYRRNFTKTITVSKSVTFSYPASQSGGTKTETVSIIEPIYIAVDVDTNLFDQSIGECKEQVNLLTGSVVATETAQIAQKIETSKKISDEIVSGFYTLIGSEISQQLSEIRPRVEALQIELLQHQANCVSKKNQLEDDFSRISERYSKLFNDIDKEIRHKIFSLNQSAIEVHSKLAANVQRSFRNVSTGISTIYNKEGNNLQAMLFTVNLKKGALSLIESAKKYLFSEKNLSVQLKQILIPVNIDTINTRHIPVLYIETKNKSNSDESSIISPMELPSFQSDAHQNKLKDFFIQSNMTWVPLKGKNREDINTFIQLELRNSENEKQIVTPRVAKQIMQLWTGNANIQTNSEI